MVQSRGCIMFMLAMAVVGASASSAGRDGSCAEAQCGINGDDVTMLQVDMQNKRRNSAASMEAEATPASVTDKEIVGYTAYEGDCFGNDLQSIEGSLKECAVACDSDATCAGFSFVSNRCILKTYACTAEEVVIDGWIFYAKSGTTTTTTKPANFQGSYFDSGGGIVTIAQTGSNVNAVSTTHSWSPATGTVSGNTISTFGMTGTLSNGQITWTNGAIWTLQGCQQWDHLPGKYLAAYTSVGRGCYDERTAKTLCLSTTDCGGINKQYNECGGGRWTLRKDVTGLTASGYDAGNLESYVLNRAWQCQACSWDPATNRYAGGYAGGVSTRFSSPDAAKSACMSLGSSSCKAITCSQSGSCTMRGSSVLKHSPSGETTYVPSAACFQGCQQWVLLPGKYLSAYTSVGSACYDEQAAKTLCLSTTDCGGINQQYNECGGSRWTLRKGVTGLTASGYDAGNLRSYVLNRACQA